MSRLTVAEAMMTLERRGPVLETAREVSRIVRSIGIEAAIIGGVAVVLHGHVRTTIDVDVFTNDAEQLAAALRQAGFAFDAVQRQFLKGAVPVHLVTSDQIDVAPRHFEELDGIRTVSVADLLNMKLKSGTENPLRAQDLADVIALIRIKRLAATFASQIDKPLRTEFRKLVKAIKREAERAG